MNLSDIDVADKLIQDAENYQKYSDLTPIIFDKVIKAITNYLEYITVFILKEQLDNKQYKRLDYYCNNIIEKYPTFNSISKNITRIAENKINGLYSGRLDERKQKYEVNFILKTAKSIKEWINKKDVQELSLNSYLNLGRDLIDTAKHYYDKDVIDVAFCNGLYGLTAYVNFLLVSIKQPCIKSKQFYSLEDLNKIVNVYPELDKILYNLNEILIKYSYYQNYDNMSISKDTVYHLLYNLSDILYDLLVEYLPQTTSEFV